MAALNPQASPSKEATLATGEILRRPLHLVTVQVVCSSPSCAVPTWKKKHLAPATSWDERRRTNRLYRCYSGCSRQWLVRLVPRRNPALGDGHAPTVAHAQHQIFSLRLCSCGCDERLNCFLVSFPRIFRRLGGADFTAQPEHRVPGSATFGSFCDSSRADPTTHLA